MLIIIFKIMFLNSFCFYIKNTSCYLQCVEDIPEKKVVVGICAMAKKAHSSSMKEIIKRLENFSRLQIIIFDEEVILNHPVEDWPLVNALISFFSKGFPLDKAIAYKNLRQPFVVNDLEMQKILQDRTEVYRVLAEHSVPHPRYTVLNREKDPNCEVKETDDSIEINSQRYIKPFVEKPIDAENHNVYIYFPQSAGGGSTHLFRKVKDRSSVYSPHSSSVRTNGSYLYEDFMQTDGTDVKIYTVGSDYQHAEARKSPCLDGKVERDANGKEVRYPVLLSAKEKLIARKVVWAFGQNVCGFDLLRANGKCYVCDVNGFSFVKTSSKYYDDCARILGTLILRAVCPTLHIPYPLGPAPEDDPVVPTTSGQMMELRCVVALVRHGDRTPKQKLKMEVKNKLFFELFERHGGKKQKNLKLKHPSQLQEVLDIVRRLLDSDLLEDPELLDKKTKLQQMKLVLEMYGSFSGINRKIQLKYLTEEECHKQTSQLVADDTPKDPSLLLILKWGGELTPAGRIQAENLGKAFRTLYPGGQGQFEAPGLGFLRLHSTFRHDLKIYSSDEGRVQMTAAAFAKGLLALEGELTPIVVQMVKSSNTEGLLDGESKTCKSQLAVKERMQSIFNQDHNFTEADYTKLNPTNTLALTNAMVFVKNPKAMCQQVHQMIKELTAKIQTLKAKVDSTDTHTDTHKVTHSIPLSNLQLYNGESWELLARRWGKLEKDFLLKTGQFQVNKIPDIYDCIKYDLQHNQQTLQFERAHELHMCSKALADIIIPQEYGITVEEKLHIAQNYCSMFLSKIRSDFQQAISVSGEDSITRLDSRLSNGVATPGRFVRTRLYFSSESHIHSVMNILRYGNFIERSDSQWEGAVHFLDSTAEFNYMSQVIFMLFEDSSKDKDSDERYHMELHFSPGAYTSCDEPSQSRGMGFRSRQSTWLTPDLASLSSSSCHPLAKLPEDPAVDSTPTPAPSFPTTTTTTTTAISGNSITSTAPMPEVVEIHTEYEGKMRPRSESQPTLKNNGENTLDSTVCLLPLGHFNPEQSESPTSAPLSHHNYGMVHMPHHSQSLSRWSLPCVSPSVLGPKMKVLYRQYTHPMEKLRMINIKPFFSRQVLEGFNYVPQLHPLETLHNMLTLHEVKEFLIRVTSVEYMSPYSSMDHLSVESLSRMKAREQDSHSLPPSASSSGMATPPVTTSSAFSRSEPNDCTQQSSPSGPPPCQQAIVEDETEVL
ncbi:inositol hexakisphosphate and diphosphoinositol-pentakisphosphate kinase 2-like isoform X2 [Babylonia areolata]|uniref:inositol hexakisphosphate and diphosphoinositol-pentakisphosphate kinase 2-like isoform X2 n=1 Tax=Babylonia areolata TaxID=304850 RepID=UPI003FD112D0